MPSKPYALLARTLRASLAAVAVLLALPAPLCAETVRLGGTGSGLAAMTVLAQEYRKLDPSFRLEVVPNLGTTGGIRAVESGAIHVAVASRAMKPEEAAAGLRAWPYGRTPFVLVTVKPDVQSLSLAQVADLYAARQSRWDDGQPVRLVLRPQHDSDHAQLASMSPQIRDALALAHAREGMVVGMTDQEAVDAVERLPGGLGTTTLALLRSEHRRAHAVSLDGVAPTLENVAGGRYRHVKTMHLVTRERAPQDVAGFMAFIASEAGRRILAETGHAAVGGSQPPAAPPAGSAPRAR